MASINDLIYDGCTLQGNLVVVRFDSGTEQNVELFHDDAQNIWKCSDKEWMNWGIKYIDPYPDGVKTVCFELDAP